MSHLVSSRPAPARLAVPALVAAAACWGLGTVASKQVVDDISPLTLLPLQLTASCLFLLGLSLVRHDRFAWSPQLRRLAGLGVLNPGVAVAVLGVVFVVYQPGAAGAATGVTLTLVSVGFCAAYTVLTRRLLLDDASLTVALVQQVAALTFAVLLATGVALVGGTGWDLAGHSAGVWAGAAVSGVLYYGLGFAFFVTGLRHVPAAYAAAFLPLIPVFGLAAGYLIGERLEPRQWIGAAAIVATTALIARWQRGTPSTT